MSAHHAATSARARTSRGAVAGRGLPTIEPGMPLPAGTGLTRRKFVARSLGARARRLRRRAAAALRRGHRERRDGRALADPGHRLPAGRRRLAVAALPGGRPALPEAPHRTSPSPAARRSPRIRASSWNPALAPLAQLHGEGKVTRAAGVGYDHPDQSHFTSRHYWEVGATEPSLLTGWLGRYLDLAGVGGQPAAGPLDHRRLEPVARDRQGAGRRDRRPRPVRASARRACGASRADPHARRDGGARQRAARATRRSPTVADVTKQSDRLRRQLLPFAGKGIASAGRLPDGRRLLHDAACRASRR